MAPLLKATFATLFIGCASEEGRLIPTAVRDESPPTALLPAATPQTARLETVEVVGVVATDLEEPVSSRTIALLDARGELHEGLTGSDGSFVFSEVTPPYDLAVAPAFTGATTVYVGIARRDPYVELFERSGPTPSPERQSLRLGIRASLCEAATCTVTASSVSPSGAGSSTLGFRKDDSTVVVDVDHGWRGVTLLPGELIDLHVLISDEDHSWFAYGRLPPIAAAPGDLVDVGMVDVVPVPASEPIAVGAQSGAGGLIDWRWNTSVFVDLDGNVGGAESFFLFDVAESPAKELRLPILPHATMRVGVSATHPRGDSQAGFFRSTESWSGIRPMPSAAKVDIVNGPEIVRPAVGAGFSRRGLGFEWSELGAPALSRLTVIDTARGVARFRVLTSEHELPLSRLAALGLPRLELGEHVLDLTTSPLSGIGDAVSPDAGVRHGRHDHGRPGARTYLRVPFQVTP